MFNRKTFGFILIALLAMVISGCAFGGAADEPADEQSSVDGPAGEEHIAAQPTSGGLFGFSDDKSEVADNVGAAEPMEESAEAEAPAASRESGADSDLGMGGGEGGEDGDVFAEADEALAMPPSDGNPSSFTPPDQEFAQPLQAGEVDDNEDFGEYLQYRLDFQKFLDYPVSHVDIGERHIINVTTRNGRPVLGAEVQVYDGQRLVTVLRTTATGKAYFFPRAYPQQADQYTVTVVKGQNSTEFGLARDANDMTWDVTLDTSPTRPPVQLDVLFLLDATGSMGDEINQLKDNILSISAQIEALPGQPDVRFGLVHYRDRGDTYVVRTVDFTGNVQRFQRELQEVRASGGGDDPEAMQEALYAAIDDMSWRVEDTVSLVFLVADAPPHLDYPQDYDYGQTMLIAAELGIKINPIGSRLDGTNAYQQQAEYIFRQIAQFTGGHFIFLTYEDTPTSSGDPGTEYSVPEDSYSVENLDQLVVRLVQAELEALTGQ